MRNRTKRHDKRGFEYWMLTVIVAGSTALSGTELLVLKYGHLRQLLHNTIRAQTKPLTQPHHQPEDLLLEVKQMEELGMLTEDIIVQLEAVHLPQVSRPAPARNVHRHSTAGLTKEIKRLIRQRLSTQQIVERLMVTCALELDDARSLDQPYLAALETVDPLGVLNHATVRTQVSCRRTVGFRPTRRSASAKLERTAAMASLSPLCRIRLRASKRWASFPILF